MTGTVHITARGIVVQDDRVLFIERWKGEQHYFSLPGGHIEKNETKLETVEREIKEETTITVVAKKIVFRMQQGLSEHTFIECQYVSGISMLSPESPEFKHATQINRWIPTWIQIDEIHTLPFGYWEPVKKLLLEGLTNSFGDVVAVVNA